MRAIFFSIVLEERRRKGERPLHFYGFLEEGRKKGGERTLTRL